MKIRVDIDPQKILESRGLGSSNRAQKYLAENVRVRCDKYVPYDTGALKNTASVSQDGRSITYPQPYAAAQFYRDYRHSDPNRGRMWHSRMLAAEKEALLRDLAAYMNGGGK